MVLSCLRRRTTRTEQRSNPFLDLHDRQQNDPNRYDSEAITK